MKTILGVLAMAAMMTASGYGDEGVPAGAPLVADGAWARALDGHPRLFGPVDELKARAKARPDLYEGLKGENSNVGGLMSAGIVNAVEGADQATIDRFVARATRDVARGLTNEHQDTWVSMVEVAEIFDYFHDSIPPEERARWIEWLNAQMGAYTEDEGAFHNSTLTKVFVYLKIAYATWGENPRAKDFRDYAIGKLYEGLLVPVMREFGQGGGFTECGWYTRGSLWNLVWGLELARRIEGYDGFMKAPRFFYNRLAYEMLQPYPGPWVQGSDRYAFEGDAKLGYSQSNLRQYPRCTRLLLAERFRGTDLARYTAADLHGPISDYEKLVDLIFAEPLDGPLDEPLPVADFPASHIAAGIGRVYARSDWSDDASWLRFECGKYFCGHQHFEVGNFEIFRYEPLATESGEYDSYLSNHSVNWLLRTIAHNCITVYMPGETWTRMRDGAANEYANDGGQTKKWVWTVPDLEKWKAQAKDFDTGEIVGYQAVPEYVYMAGDCARAYKPEKVKSYVRQIVFVRPHAFVVFDRVESANPDYAKAWLLHSRNEPEISGDTFTVRDGKGTLVTETLLPKGAKIEKMYGYTYGGQTFDERKTDQTDLAAKWRVEVRPAEPARGDLFLHVLSTDGPVDARLVEKDGAVGVAFGDTQVMFSGPVGGTLTLKGKAYPLEAKVVTGKYED